MDPPEEVRADRTRALLATLPFLGLGIADLVLILGWGLEPLWGFLVLPPILFMCALTWIAFRTGLARDRTGRQDSETDAESAERPGPNQ